MNKIMFVGTQNKTVYRFKKHTHRHWEITLYTHGTGQNITGGNSYSFSENTLICQPPDVEHEDVSAGGYQNIFVSTSLFPAGGKLTPFVFHNVNNNFYSLMHILLEEFNNGQIEIANNLLTLINQYIFRMIKDSPALDWIGEIKRGLIENISNPAFRVEEYLLHYHFHFDYIRRKFKQTTGISIKDYLIDLRIAQAQHLLKNSSLSISEISVMCGYEDPLYFSRLFKKYCGTSPRNFVNL